MKGGMGMRVCVGAGRPKLARGDVSKDEVAAVDDDDCEAMAC